jgi:hypothetical protein
MERNYSMMLKQLQMGFMSYTMKDNNEEEQCVLCWKSNCGCKSNNTVKNDPFLNLTTISEFQQEDELILA